MVCNQGDIGLSLKTGSVTVKDHYSGSRATPTNCLTGPIMILAYKPSLDKIARLSSTP